MRAAYQMNRKARGKESPFLRFRSAKNAVSSPFHEPLQLTATSLIPNQCGRRAGTIAFSSLPLAKKRCFFASPHSLDPAVKFADSPMNCLSFGQSAHFPFHGHKRSKFIFTLLLSRASLPKSTLYSKTTGE